MSKPVHETHGYSCNKHLFVSCLLSSYCLVVIVYCLVVSYNKHLFVSCLLSIYLGKEQQQNSTVYIILH